MSIVFEAVLEDGANASLFSFLQESGFYKGWSFDKWHRYMLWSCINNPYREDRPIGFVLKSEDAVVKAYVTAYYVPFYYLKEYCVATSFGDFCASQSLSLKDKIRFVQQYFANCATNMIVGMHASKATYAIWQRFGAQAVSDTKITYFKYSGYWQRFIRKMGCCLTVKENTVSRDSFSFCGKKIFYQRMDSVTQYSVFFQEDFGMQSIYYDIGMWRDRKYLCWRYLMSPFKQDYYFIRFGDDQPVCSCIIQKVGIDARLCELFVDSSKLSNKVLLKFLMAVTQKLNCVCISLKPVYHLSEKELLLAGFKKKEKSYNQILYKMNSVIEYRQDIQILYTFGDVKLY